MKPAGYLVVSHAHPDFSKGGGELAAYNAFKGFSAAFPRKPARFLAAVNFEVPAGVICKYKDSEYLLGSIVTDHSISSGSPAAVAKSLDAFSSGFYPELINLHHYFNVGLETILLLRRMYPAARMILTLHEFLAICRNDGQMIKRDSRSLCYEANPFACNRCFPQTPISDNESRKNTLMSVFDQIDVFITPSEFLRQRYIEWGLPAERIFVVENGQQLLAVELAPTGGKDKDKEKGKRHPNRFGYFGQINPYKGMDVLLAAATYLVNSGFEDFVIEVNGANLDNQPPEFQARVNAMLKPLVESGHVLWNGPYGRSDFPHRISRVDWLVMPSIWWENSPMVIQEAFFYGKPVICSGIGGMAEKVKDGVSGYHVPVGSVMAWAEAIRKACGDPARHTAMCAQLPRPPTVGEMARAYVAI